MSEETEAALVTQLNTNVKMISLNEELPALGFEEYVLYVKGVSVCVTFPENTLLKPHLTESWFVVCRKRWPCSDGILEPNPVFTYDNVSTSEAHELVRLNAASSAETLEALKALETAMSWYKPESTEVPADVQLKDDK